jgi:hypothetical protein
MNSKVNLNARDRVFFWGYNGISPLGIALRFHHHLAKLFLVYLKAEE